MIKVRNLIRIISCVLLSGAFPVFSQTQRAARVVTRQQEPQEQPESSYRAQAKYPRSKALPQDVIWMREIYRTLDVNKEPNGSLYYPVEPVAGKANLLGLIFKLLGENKITAYEYRLDGVEQLLPEYTVRFRDLLDRFQIYYEARKNPGRSDTLYVVNGADIPSAEVKSYFIKEVWYFDQRTSTYGSVVTALCPVMHRSEDFVSEEMKLPMCWINYQDLAPYLTGTFVMTSSLNNTAGRSIDDFFASRLYKGDIYKVTNLQNRSLAEYCETDTALAGEQRRIEAELAAFESRLYGTDGQTAAKADTIPAEKKKGKASKSTVTKDSSTPKASVRRQRR